MTEASIVEAVRICIDEIGINDAAWIQGADDSDMDTIIKSKILDAIRYIYNHADWSVLVPDMTIDAEAAEPEEDSDGIWKADIDMTNFLRLCFVKGENWHAFVTEPILWTDAEYATLSDFYSTGSNVHPKAGIAPYAVTSGGTTTSGYRLKVYSCEDPGDITVGYMQIPTEGTGDNPDYSLNGDIVPAVIYYIAGLTLLTYNDQHADDMFKQALVLARASEKQA